MCLCLGRGTYICDKSDNWTYHFEVHTAQPILVIFIYFLLILTTTLLDKIFVEQYAAIESSHVNDHAFTTSIEIFMH